MANLFECCINNGDTVDVSYHESKQELIEALLTELVFSEVTTGEFIAAVTLPNLSVEDVVEVYAHVIYRAEQDKLILIQEGEQHDLWKQDVVEVYDRMTHQTKRGEDVVEVYDRMMHRAKQG